MSTVVAQRQRLAGLDGVRGLAALYVVVFRIFLRTFPGSVFEIPFLRHRTSSWALRAEGVPG